MALNFVISHSFIHVSNLRSHSPTTLLAADIVQHFSDLRFFCPPPGVSRFPDYIFTLRLTRDIFFLVIFSLSLSGRCDLVKVKLLKSLLNSELVYLLFVTRWLHFGGPLLENKHIFSEAP